MNLKVLLVDDEQEALNRLQLHLKKFPELSTIDTALNGQEALSLIEEERPDIVFMDIEMPEMTGIEVLRRCKEPYPYFIFVTAYNEYAIEAFAQNAIDYVLKPYAPERIETALKRAVKMTEKDELAKAAEKYRSLVRSIIDGANNDSDKAYIKRIAAKSTGITSFINVEDVIVIKAADQYVEVQTLEKQHIVRESINQLEKVLDPNLFFRTHRSFIVNIDQVTAIKNVDKHTSLIVLKNSYKAKLSNSRKSEFKKKMES